MAEGRMLLRSVASNEQLERVSFEADYLFARCIPFLDVEGRMPGQPGRVRAMVCPLRPEMTTAVVERCLGELAREELVVWYDTPDGKVLSFPSFHRHNKVRRDREAPSKLPPPPGERPDHSGTTPGVVPEHAGSTPGELHLEVEVEGKVEGKVEGTTYQPSRALVVIDGAAAARPRARRDAIRAQLRDSLSAEEREYVIVAITDALPPSADGRDVVMDVMRVADRAGYDPGRFLWAAYSALRPRTGRAATPEQVGLALERWLTKRKNDDIGHFCAFMERARHERDVDAPRARAGPGTAGASTYEAALEAVDGITEALTRRLGA